jgi:cell division protein FtsB
VGRVALLLVVLGLLISYIGPLLDLGRTFHLSRESSADLQQVRVENEKLQRRAELLQSEAALKREARRQGMIAEGERAYVISGLRR